MQNPDLTPETTTQTQDTPQLEELPQEETPATPDATEARRSKKGRFLRKHREKQEKPQRKPINPHLLGLFLWISYFLVEVFAGLLLKPDTVLPYAFAACWSLIFTAVTISLPKIAGRIFYGITYFIFAAWAIAQTGYNELFNKIMWLSDIRYADEGMGYIDVLLGFDILWWIGTPFLIIQGVLLLRRIPQVPWKNRPLISGAVGITASIIALLFLPQAIYALDNGVWGTKSEYGQSSSAKASYTVMYDNRRVYDLCGLYHYTFKDLWAHEIYPLTPAYQAQLKSQVQEVDDYFEARPESNGNEMTGIFHDKKVILVLMESMDDWLITEEDTPTICRLMEEGINFTNFYTPGYGSVRTFNTEFCTNTGVYLPTTGQYVFDYVTNDFSQSLANVLEQDGYDPLCFHYNSPDFYSRGVFEPAMGYREYVTFEDYTENEDDLFSDTYLWDSQELRNLFFRPDVLSGKTLNFVITRSAHLSYTYREVLSYYALKQYPEYKGKYGDEEVDCARVKARLVDDMFARLLQELEEAGELENTVIVAVTDHYTYGFKDTELLLELSGVEDELLLEKTPCFIWSADGPSVQVEKTLNTADLLPTVLNLLDLGQEYHYLGQDAFDPNYVGYALFPDGSWISDGVACKINESGEAVIVMNEKGKTVTEADIQAMAETSQAFIHTSNLLLATNYYAR